MVLEILGSGTSHGVPVIGCRCSVCQSKSHYDKRYRSSAWIHDETQSISILIDCSPEFRLQAIRSCIEQLHAVLITHSHADHIHGLDDVRVFCATEDLPLYGESHAITDITHRFSYAFTPPVHGRPYPHFCATALSHKTPSVVIKNLRFVPIPLIHGKLISFGWRLGDLAYLTDCNALTHCAYTRLKGVKKVIVNGLRFDPHPTHFSFLECLELFKELDVDCGWITHISHSASHREIHDFIKSVQQTDASLAQKKIEPAYDGLTIAIAL